VKKDEVGLFSQKRGEGGTMWFLGHVLLDAWLKQEEAEGRLLVLLVAEPNTRVCEHVKWLLGGTAGARMPTSNARDECYPV